MTGSSTAAAVALTEHVGATLVGSLHEPGVNRGRQEAAKRVANNQLPPDLIAAERIVRIALRDAIPIGNFSSWWFQCTSRGTSSAQRDKQR